MKTLRYSLWAALLALLITSFLMPIACAGDDDDSSGDDDTADDDDSSGDEPVLPEFSASNFSDPATIDNPYMSWIPGYVWTYVESTEDGDQDVVVTVTSDTKTIMGIDCVVVHDIVTMDGETIEDTLDWYAQDDEGNVWYMGEDTAEYEDGEIVSTEGSWEGGVDGALPGIVMYADPQVGDYYYQEYYPGEAEDLGEVIALNETVTVEAGTFENCVVIEETNPLEPDVLEHKYHCPDVANVALAEDKSGEGDREELVEMTMK